MGKKRQNTCPCGSGKPYTECCSRYIDGDEIPETPEQLMRSRYTAYARNNKNYLLSTWHNSTRPLSLPNEDHLPLKWIELKVLACSEPLEEQDRATVEFVARYKINGKSEKMHEISEFIKEKDRWYYLHGKVS